MQLNETQRAKRSLGALRKASKTKPKSPDLTGLMRLQRHTAAEIVKQFGTDNSEEVVCNIAGWRNADHNGSYLTVELSPRYVAKALPDRDDVIGSIINDQEEETNIETI